MGLTNAQVAELLARRAEEETEHRQRALRRATRAALMWWPEEIEDYLAAGGKLTELQSVGPWIARQIVSWLEEPPGDLEPPALRSGFISYSSSLALMERFPDLLGDLRGDLQMHSTYSDGKASIEEMARAALGLGYEYVAITDHSKGLKIAGGIDEPTLAQQADEIERLNQDLEREGTGFRVLRALEMNIDPDGEGDMEADALEPLELVLGSFHSQLRRTEDQTDRYLAAIRNPHVNVLGHPRGRKYNLRAGLTCDWRSVFEEGARLGKAIEMNAYPDRQDVGVELLTLAAECGAWVSIGTDSHHPEELRFVTLGLASAHLAGLPRERIVNYLSAPELVEWARAARGST